MHSETQIEAQLIKAMKRIAVPYRSALSILREHHAAPTTRAGVASSPTNQTRICELLQRPMEMIADYERTVGPLRTQWNSLRKTANGDLQQVIDEQSKLLKELMELLDGVEQQMLSSRTHLASRLDDSQRQMAMRQAYRPATTDSR